MDRSGSICETTSHQTSISVFNISFIHYIFKVIFSKPGNNPTLTVTLIKNLL